MPEQLPGPPPEPPDAAPRRERDPGRKAQDDAFGALGLLMSGVLFWGGVGYLVSRWLGSPLFTMVGLLVGTGSALYLVWFRYGRS